MLPVTHMPTQEEYERLLSAAFARGFLAGTPRAAKLLEACDKVMKRRHERSSAAEKQAAQQAEDAEKRWSAVWQPEVDDVAVQSLKKALVEIDAAIQQLREKDHALEETLREHHQREAVSLMPVCNIAVKMRCAKVSECADDLLQQILHEVEVDGGEVEVEKVSIPALHRTVVRATPCLPAHVHTHTQPATLGASNPDEREPTSAPIPPVQVEKVLSIPAPSNRVVHAVHCPPAPSDVHVQCTAISQHPTFRFYPIFYPPAIDLRMHAPVHAPAMYGQQQRDQQQKRQDDMYEAMCDKAHRLQFLHPFLRWPSPIVPAHLWHLA